MGIRADVAELRRLGDQLLSIDIGYPLDGNSVHAPGAAEDIEAVLSRVAGGHAKDELTLLYTECDGVSLPDVHVGYFIKPARKLDSFDRSSEPDTLQFDGTRPVLPIGSTGGGSLFVVDCQTGHVLLLPPGPLYDGTYDGTGLPVREVAESVESFINRLTADVRAFVNDTPHIYLE